MSDKPTRVAVYARVSTDEQTPENQLLDPRHYCQDRVWTVIEEFVDQGISGTKARRPALDRLRAGQGTARYGGRALHAFGLSMCH